MTVKKTKLRVVTVESAVNEVALPAATKSRSAKNRRIIPAGITWHSAGHRRVSR